MPRTPTVSERIFGEQLRRETKVRRRSEAAKRAWDTRRRKEFHVESLNTAYVPDLLVAVEILSGELRAFGPTDEGVEDAWDEVRATFQLVTGRRVKRKGKKRDWK